MNYIQVHPERRTMCATYSRRPVCVGCLLCTSKKASCVQGLPKGELCALYTEGGQCTLGAQKANYVQGQPKRRAMCIIVPVYMGVQKDELCTRVAKRRSLCTIYMSVLCTQVLKKANGQTSLALFTWQGLERRLHWVDLTSAQEGALLHGRPSKGSKGICTWSQKACMGSKRRMYMVSKGVVHGIIKACMESKRRTIATCSIHMINRYNQTSATIQQF